MRTCYLVLAGAVLYGASGCSRHRADETALRDEQFTPEAGRRALLNLIRKKPATFVNQREALEDAEKHLIAQGEGRFKLGAFTIDETKCEYRLYQIPRAQPGKIGVAHDWNDYHGFFEFVDGCWVAHPPTLTVRRIEF